MRPLLKYDRKLLTSPGGIIGIDEVGRGALAGPVVAAAAWLSCEFYEKASRLKGVELINDSKLLNPPKREAIYSLIEKWTAKGWIKFCSAEGSIEEIEDYNILGATRLAMQRCLESLMSTMPTPYRISKSSGMPLWDRLTNRNQNTCAHLFIDGLPLKPFDYAHHAIIEGDSHSLAIATASIIAKVQRDRLMTALSKEYPAYGFADHKGYATDFHRTVLTKQGPTNIHRTLFLRKILDETQSNLNV